MDILDNISQVMIMVLGASAIWLVCRLEHWRRWGYILGMCSQPFWLYTTIKHEQWGIVALSIWYTYSWGQGIYNYWIRKEKTNDKKIYGGESCSRIVGGKKRKYRIRCKISSRRVRVVFAKRAFL